LTPIHGGVYGIGMDTTNVTFTANAPVFHQRLIRALQTTESKVAQKRLAEALATGREKGWNK
jgi:hypothetical protein